MNKNSLPRLLLDNITIDGHAHWHFDHTPNSRPIITIENIKYDVQSLILFAFCNFILRPDHHPVAVCSEPHCCNPGHLIYLPTIYTRDVARKAWKVANKSDRGSTVAHLEKAANPKRRGKAKTPDNIEAERQRDLEYKLGWQRVKRSAMTDAEREAMNEAARVRRAGVKSDVV